MLIRKILLRFLVLILAMGISHQAWCVGVVPLPFRISLRPLEMPTKPGPVNLLLDVKRLGHVRLDSAFMIEVEAIDGLRYSGETLLTPDLDENDSLHLILPVVISPDTSNGIEVTVRQGAYLRASVFFKTYGDSVQFFNGFLQERFRGRPIKQPEHILGGWIRGEFPDLDSIYGPVWDSISAAREAYRDSMIKATGAGAPRPDWDIAYLTMTDMEWKRRLMVLKEDTALSGRPIESYRVGDTMFYRLEGQKQFRPLTPGFSFVPRIIETKSGRTVDPDQVVTGFTRIRSAEQLELARDICDSVFATVRDSVYFVFVARRNLKKLFGAGLTLDVGAPEPAPKQPGEESAIPQTGR